MNTLRNHREEHIRIGHYLKDIIFAANDGIITTFAVIAGVAGAHLSPITILVLGSANIIADGFAMAIGNFLGTNSEKEFYQKEEANERWEIEHNRDKEIHEVREILEHKGYEGKKLEDITKLVISNKQHWIDFMMHEEMGLVIPDNHSAFKKAVVTFLSFAIAGSLPLLPYIVRSQQSFGQAIIITALALFSIGALRAFFSHRFWFFLGLEMLILGGSAASLAYLVGMFIKLIVGL